MAAERAHCACCREPFERRAYNQFYCFRPACRRAHNAANVRAWRETTAHREHVRRAVALARARGEMLGLSR